MRSEKLAADNRRKRRVDDVEVYMAELVTCSCVTEAAVDSADAFHATAAVESHVYWFHELVYCRRKKIEWQDILVSSRIAKRAKFELESLQI